MREKILLKTSSPAWILPGPRLRQESLQPSLHALACARRRTWITLIHETTSSLVQEGAREFSSVGSRRCRRMANARRMGSDLRVEGCSGEDLVQNNQASCDPNNEEQSSINSRDGGLDATASDINLGDSTTMNKAQQRRRKEVCQTHVQQQALIRRMKTLEARRDWRGVLAAMVSLSWRLEQYAVPGETSYA